MERREFLKKSFKIGAGTCLGLQIMANSQVFGAESLKQTNSTDGFLKLFDWIDGALNGDLTVFFETGSKEFKILNEIKKGWGKENTVDLFKSLSVKYGEEALSTMRKFIKKTSVEYWKSQGEKFAKPGQELDGLGKALWENLGSEFKYSMKKEDGFQKFTITDCPFAQLAKQSQMPEWVYAMACITDYYIAPSFSENIGFDRTKTLVQGDESCDHTYYYRKEKTTKDALLGYCGLYCGACPSHQKTAAYTPTKFSKENALPICEGCNSSINAEWCAKCEIKACAKKKNLRVCLNCDDFPCNKMTAFIDDPKYPYHKEVTDKMKQYNEKGLENWLESQEKSYHCSSCGSKFNFFDTTCPKCGTKL